jgi:hypothetical protein
VPPGVLETSHHAIPDDTPLEFSHSSDDCEYGLPHRRRGVESLLIRDEVNSETPKLFERDDKLFGTPGESVKPPNDHNVESTPPRVNDELIKVRPPFLGTADSVRVDTLQFPPALPDHLD